MWPKRSVARKGEAVGRRRTKPLGSGTEDPAQAGPRRGGTARREAGAVNQLNPKMHFQILGFWMRGKAHE